MGRILIVNDEARSRDVLLAALRQAYANMRVSERSKGGVIVIDSLSTLKENKKMISPWPIPGYMKHYINKYTMDPWELRKDNSRSMFLTDARSKRPSHKGREKKVNRLRVRKKVNSKHRRK